MKVWVLLSKSYYDDPVFVDIFATKELADQALAAIVARGAVNDYHVEEYEVIGR